MAEDYLKILCKKVPLILEKILIEVGVEDIPTLCETSQYLKDFILSKKELKFIVKLLENLEPKKARITNDKMFDENKL